MRTGKARENRRVRQSSANGGAGRDWCRGREVANQLVALRWIRHPRLIQLGTYHGESKIQSGNRSCSSQQYYNGGSGGQAVQRSVWVSKHKLWKSITSRITAPNKPSRAIFFSYN